MALLRTSCLLKPGVSSSVGHSSRSLIQPKRELQFSTIWMALQNDGRLNHLND